MKKIIDYFENITEISHAFLIGNVFLTEIKDDLNKIICSKIFNNEIVDIYNNQDVYILDQNEALITREDARELLSKLSTTSQFNDIKVYIINGVEKISDVVSNSLLKTLEEPKNNIYAFLITKNIDSVKETIKSRCQRIILNSNDENIENDENVEKLSNILIKNIEKNSIKTIAFNNEIYNLIEDRETLKKVIACMLTKYKKCLKEKIDNNEKSEDISEISKNNDIITLSKKILVINETIGLLDNYLNKNLTIDRFIIEMWRC